MIIVYAHPQRTGHCGHILQAIQKELEQNEKKYEIWDLYEQKFDPLLRPEEVYLPPNVPRIR